MSIAVTPPEGVPPRKEHLRYLDSLRGFAAVATIMVHCCYMLDITGIIGNWGMSGQRGVQLFYIISAFTLCYSFDVRRNDEKHSLRNYFIRRFFRIAPLFYVAVVANLLYQGLAPREEAPDGLSPWDIVLGLFFLNGLVPHAVNSVAIGGWSIAVETTFYLVLPLILSVVKTVRQAFLLLVVSAPLAYVLSHGCAHFYHDKITREYFILFWFPVEFPVFVMGIYTYLVWKTYFKGREMTHRKILSLSFIANFFLLFWTAIPVSHYRIYWSSFAFVFLLLGLSLHEWKFIVNPITVYLGRISYSIYLSQFFVLCALPQVWHFAQSWISFHTNGNHRLFVIDFIGVSLVSIAISTVTYFLIEKPGIHWGGKMIKKWEQKPISERI